MLAMVLFALLVRSKLRGTDLVRFKIINIVSDDRVRSRVTAKRFLSAQFGALI